MFPVPLRGANCFKNPQERALGCQMDFLITFAMLALERCTIAHLKRHKISKLLISIKSQNSQEYSSYKHFPKIPFYFMPPGIATLLLILY